MEHSPEQAASPGASPSSSTSPASPVVEPALTLYGTASSRTARPLWMLEELGLPYRRLALDYRHRATRTASFLAINPNGRIPALVDGEIVVWESMAITLYLARRAGGPLAPANLAEEAEVLRWTFWAMSECEKDALHLLFQRAVWPTERRDEQSAVQAERRLAVPLRVLEQHLGGRDWIAAERFTVADLNVAAVLAWARASRQLMDDFPLVAAWLARCLKRPAQLRVRAMAKADEASLAGMANVGTMGRAAKVAGVAGVAHDGTA